MANFNPIQIWNSTSEIPKLPESLALKTPYEPDTFQKFAIHSIEKDENVLVTAPTGSGKTFVGEYAIAYQLQKGKRVFYTTPIKSLSNQKFHDLKTMWPNVGDVGIMTGDIKFCPDAKIIVMTTEILRNLLYKVGTNTEHIGITASLSIQDLGAVVFDECHYINDKDRGKVWEETMILLPREVQLIMLSATLDSPQFFAEWIGELKNKTCNLIQTTHRIVPLTHYVLRNGELEPIMNAKEDFLDGNYMDWVRMREKQEKEHALYQKKVKAERRAGTEGAIEGKVKPVSFIHQLNACIRMLDEKELLPALVFVLSRKGCEQHASKTESTLLDSSDSAIAQRIFDFHLRHHKQKLETLPQYHTLRELIIRGIGFHHSGVIPVLKEVIEILFTKGYIKLLYCTETFAVGINMPTKSVIFTGLSKYDDATEGMRYLRTDEYIQMAGRAGRRGKDKIGYVLYLPEREPPSCAEMRLILKGGRPKIMSRMDFHYDFLLKCLQSKNTRWIEIQEQSYWYKQQSIILSKEREHQGKLRGLMETYLSDDTRKDYEEKSRLEALARETTNAKRREVIRQLERWKDMHLGPKWVQAEKRWLDSIKIEKDLLSCETTIRTLEGSNGNVTTWLSILKDTNYLTDENTLTEKGVLATEFNEGHSLLCAEFFTRHLHEGISGEELITAMSCLMEDKETDTTPTLEELQVSENVRSSLVKMDKIVEEFRRLEDAYKIASPGNYWLLTTTWVEPIWRWIHGEHASVICNEYGLFEGNFVRSVLRVANMVDEWIAVATFVEDIALLEKLQSVRQLLVRDFLVPDSLYLHL
jgi:superfamily II RNA helicase